MTNNDLPNYRNEYYRKLLTRHLGMTLRAMLLLVISTSSVETRALSESEKIINDNCKGCHGINGVTKVDNWPNLNCQNRGYLYSRLMHFRNEDEHNIDVRVKSLSLSEIGDISKYYSEQECSK